MHGELADLKTRAHLQELVDLSFRFALAYEALIPKVRRERLYRKDAGPERLLELFVAVNKVGSDAQKKFENEGVIDPTDASTLNDLLDSLRTLVG